MSFYFSKSFWRIFRRILAKLESLILGLKSRRVISNFCQVDNGFFERVAIESGNAWKTVARTKCIRIVCKNWCVANHRVFAPFGQKFGEVLNVAQPLGQIVLVGSPRGMCESYDLYAKLVAHGFTGGGDRFTGYSPLALSPPRDEWINSLVLMYRIKTNWKF